MSTRGWCINGAPPPPQHAGFGQNSVHYCTVNESLPRGRWAPSRGRKGQCSTDPWDLVDEGLSITPPEVEGQSLLAPLVGEDSLRTTFSLQKEVRQLWALLKRSRERWAQKRPQGRRWASVQAG